MNKKSGTSKDAADKLVRGIKRKTRKDDYCSGNVLTPLGMTDCIRISLCHYNSEWEVAQFLNPLAEMPEG